MRIVIQPSGLRCLNVGDQAMLEVAYERLRAKWPKAEICVFTLAPDEIRRRLPGAIPIAPDGRDQCFDLRLFGRLSKPGYPLWKVFAGLEELAFERAPAVQGLAARAKMKARGAITAANIISTIQSTDLFVFSGAGMITDAFEYEAAECLELLALAKRFGGRAAILGHMFGPVTNEHLKAVCQRVLPIVDLISVREQVTSLPFLAGCGVRVEDVRVTGDETLEFIDANRAPASERNALGVNVRISYYSGLTPAATRLLCSTIHSLAVQFGAPLEPLAVAHHAEDDDALALRFIGSSAQMAIESSGPETALGFAHRVAKCRLVITGSYHAAVFALAQGIPAIGLAFGPYYEAKFKGLRDLFGDGCRYVDGSKPGWDEQLQKTAADLWRNAHCWRDELLEAASTQVAKSRAAYDELQAIVEGKKVRRAPAAGLRGVASRAAAEGT